MSSPSLARVFTVAAMAVALLVSGTAVKSRGHGSRHEPPPYERAQRPLRSAPTLELRSIDGSGNNTDNPTWGVAGTNYLRLAPANYADGIGAMAAGPNPRRISNAIFNDAGQNLFSENNISQWGWAWGQFLDHDMGLRDETPAEDASMAWNARDGLESFQNDFGGLRLARTPAAPGTGVSSTREQVNTLSSYIDASNVYGVTADRAHWLRNDDGTLFLPDNYLPKVTARGDAATAPTMDFMGRLAGNKNEAVVAGDVRANENIALTSIQTLFAREHNRIVSELPEYMSGDKKYDIAREAVGAEVQYITYNEFLPALGVKLPKYRGYRSDVNPGLSNEFATVGFRAHSMVHGEFEVEFDGGEYSPEQLTSFAAEGIKVINEPDDHSLVIPLSVAFGNPSLLPRVGLGSVLAALGGERQYRNDEQIDNTMRSVLFEVPRPGTTDPTACQTPVVDPRCFSGVADLGADDVQRGRDHGMPNYNAMRAAYGLPPVASFTELTGEATDAMGGMRMNNPHVLDFVQLHDREGEMLPAGSDEAGEDAVSGVRRTPLAARLKAVYGSVDKVDAFVGMVSEPHVAGTEFGPLQLAIWKDQFTRARDADRYFYEHDPALEKIERRYGLRYEHSLADIIALNAGVVVGPDVFHAPEPEPVAEAETAADGGDHAPFVKLAGECADADRSRHRRNNCGS